MRRALTAAVLALLFAGCLRDPVGQAVDAGPDALRGPDGATDASPDATLDATPDAAVDAALDAAIDAALDAVPDVPVADALVPDADAPDASARDATPDAAIPGGPLPLHCPERRPFVRPEAAIPFDPEVFATDAPLWNAEVADVNCDGYDDLLAPVPERHRIELLLGGPDAPFAGGHLSIATPGRPHRLLVGRFGHMPRADLMVLLDDGGWRLVGMEGDADGTSFRERVNRDVARRFVSAAGAGSVPLHLVVREEGPDGPLEIVAGDLGGLFPVAVSWDPDVFGVDRGPAPFLPPSGAATFEAVRVIPIARAGHPTDLLIGQTHDAVFYRFEEGVQDQPLRHAAPGGALRFYTQADLTGDGVPEAIGSDNSGAAQIMIAQAVPPGEERPDGTVVWRDLLQPIELRSGVLVGIVATSLTGDARVDVAVIEHAGDAVPPGASRLHLLEDVRLDQDDLIDARRTAWAFAADFHPQTLVAGDFDGDGEQEVVATARSGDWACVEANPSGAPRWRTCEWGARD